MQTTLWGIDLGGTKIEGVVLAQPDANAVMARMRIPTEAEKGYQQILQNIGRLVDLLVEQTKQVPTHIGIGTPGTLDPLSQVMKNSNSTALNGKPLRNDLEKLLGLPVLMANDANCFALAEATMGAIPKLLPEAQSVFGVIMGTGVGAGIAIRNPDGSFQVLNGRQGIAGEWGHNFLDESGGQCYCGKVGCVETVISGTALQKYYAALAPKPLTLKEIYQNYLKQNDQFAGQTMERLVQMFAKAIANVINILDPDAIVLGGGVGNIDLLYQEALPEVKKYVFNHRLDTVFLKPKLGDSAGVFGAAML